MKVDTRKLVITAMLITLDVLFTRVLAINTNLMKIGFGFAAVGMSALLYGPAWAMLSAALGDFVGSLLFPSGPFFPGFTLTAAVSGLIFGLCLYKKEARCRKPVLAAALNSLVVTVILNTAMIAYISGNSFSVLLAARSVQFLVMFPVQALLLGWLSRSEVMERIFEKYK